MGREMCATYPRERPETSSTFTRPIGKAASETRWENKNEAVGRRTEKKGGKKRLRDEVEAESKK